MTMLLFLVSAFAAGSMNLKGTLRNTSPESIDIESGGWVYTLKNKKLGAQELKFLKSKKSLDKVDIWVNFAAIQKTKKL